MKKASVIMPCYNQSLYIKDSILSVINQTYPNIEIICIDDCSNDDSAKIIKFLAQKYINIIFLTNLQNSGVVKSRNRAINMSSVQYIPLDGDDMIAESYIEKAVVEQKEVQGIINCYSDKPVKIKKMVEYFIKENHLKIQPDYGKYPSRPCDLPCVYGNAEKINKIRNCAEL